jgi:cobyrinic acid a,c-diamide synthase
MIVIVFSSVNDALDKLMKIKVEFDDLATRYERMIKVLESNSRVEERMRKMGYEPAHVSMTIPVNMTSTVRIHMVPQSSWLLDKARGMLERTRRIREELDRVVKAMGRLSGVNATVALFLDEEEARSRVVLLP